MTIKAKRNMDKVERQVRARGSHALAVDAMVAMRPSARRAVLGALRDSAPEVANAWADLIREADAKPRGCLPYAMHPRKRPLCGR